MLPDLHSETDNAGERLHQNISVSRFAVAILFVCTCQLFTEDSFAEQKFTATISSFYFYNLTLTHLLAIPGLPGFGPGSVGFWFFWFGF